MGNDRTIFLTGSTGLVGSEIIRHLIGSQDVSLYLLIRASNETELDQRFYALLFDLGLDPLDSDSIRPVRGDICANNLGLDPIIADQLAQEVTDVIHCASDVNFGLSLGDARKVNLLGTVNLIDVITGWERILQIAHISTVQVAGKRKGVIYENELFHSYGFVNSYEQSKYEAEVYLRGLMGDLPIAVYRASGLVGDSRTGCVRQFNWLHKLLRMYTSNLLPMLPGDPDMHVDLIPIDWLVEKFLLIFIGNFEPGTTYHMAAGKENSLTIREMVELTHRCLVQAASTHARTFRMPKIIDQEDFARLQIQSSKTAKNSEAKLLHTLLGDFIPQWFLPKTFDITNLRKALPESCHKIPDINFYYQKIIDYCLRSKWGRVKELPRISQSATSFLTGHDV